MVSGYSRPVVGADLGRRLLALPQDQRDAFLATLEPADLDLIEAAIEAADIELAAERKTLPLSKAETFRRLGYEPICKPRVLALLAGVPKDEAPPLCGRCPQEQFHQASEFDVLYGGAAGPGKSRALVCEGLAAAMSFPGIRILGVRETYDALAESLLAELEKMDWARALGAVWNDTKHNLRFSNGSLFRFRHARTVEHAKLRMGGECQLLLPDERGLTDPEVIDHLMERLRSSRPEIPVLGVRSATNPGGPGHSRLKERYVDATEHGAKTYVDEHGFSVRFVAGKFTDNPYLGDDYVRRLSAIPDPMRRAAMKDGSWDVFAGQFFETWNWDRHTVEPFPVPPEWAREEGVDYGFGDPFCVLFGAVDNDGRVWIWNELYASKVTQTDQARRILAVERADGHAPRTRAADPSMWSKTGEANSNADIYRDEGCRLERANNNRPSGWARVRHYMSDAPACDHHRSLGWETCPRLHVFRHACPNLIRTLPALPRDRRKPEDLDTHSEDHAADALRYLLMEQGVGEVVVTTSHLRSQRIPTGVSSTRRHGATLTAMNGHGVRR